MMRIEILPCLSDNYAYLLICDKTNEAAIVDASETEPIVRAASALAKRPSRILSTHHHFDHTGANLEVAKALKISEIVGHESDRGRIPGQTHFLKEGDSFAVGELRIDVLHVPGHTTGAIAYVVTDGSEHAVFTGDTLFIGGCGRLFEGTPEMMFTSMAKLAALPLDTRVYCGHEYTEANLRFAAFVEPENLAVKNAIERAKARRAKQEPTMGTTLGDERATNPFVRAKTPEELGERRQMKDVFKG